MSNNPLQLVIVLLVIGGLILVMKWVFTPSRKGLRVTERPPDASASPDLGLLDVVISGVTRGEAMSLRARLGDANIRSSMSGRRDGSMDVLVFRGDVDRAKNLLQL